MKQASWKMSRDNTKPTAHAALVQQGFLASFQKLQLLRKGTKGSLAEVREQESNRAAA